MGGLFCCTQNDAPAFSWSQSRSSEFGFEGPGWITMEAAAILNDFLAQRS